MKNLLAYIVTFWPTEELPHHGIYFRDHAEALAEFEDVAVIFVCTPSLRESGQLRSSIHIEHSNNVHLVRIDQPVLTHRSQFLIDRSARKALNKGLQEIENYFDRSPSLYIAQTALPPGRYARWLQKETGIPYGVIDHFSFLQKMLDTQRTQMEKVYRHASFIGTVSDYLKSVITSAGITEAEIQTVGNVLGRAFEHADFRPPPDQTNSFRWLWIGPDDTEKKGVDLLHDTFDSLDHDNWTLTIIGNGDFRQIRESSFRNNVTILKDIRRPEMVRIMQEHHALISTSRVETFGMALLETLSTGRPVVSTACGGPQEWIPEFAGKIVPPEDRIALTNATQQVMEGYASFDQSRIREYIVHRFGAAAYYRKLKDMIDR